MDFRKRQVPPGVNKDSVIAVLVNRGDEYGWEPKRKAKPTVAVPGSNQKIEELADRAARGEDLWNDQDVTGYGSDD